MMNWSEHEREELLRPRPIIVPLMIWIAVILALIFILSGCAQTFSGTCALKPIGMDGNGIHYAMVHCEKGEVE